MTNHSPTFDPSLFELRGDTDFFLSPEQQTEVSSLSVRVGSHLDWLAQLLGWSGRDYWNNLNLSLNQKRQVLGGSFGVYGSYAYPEIVEVRNWEDSVIVKGPLTLRENQEFTLGENTYTLSSAFEENGNLVLSFGDLTDQFFADLHENKQLKFTNRAYIPEPFARARVGVSGDRYFSCKSEDGKLTLYPLFDKGHSLPYFYNFLIRGSRYFFDLPVCLRLSANQIVSPSYDFENFLWFLDVPDDLSQYYADFPPYLEHQNSQLQIGILNWKDPSDWVNSDTLKNFLGVWGNKGGPLPFHFCFDALSLHGFDERKSLHLPKIVREVDFDKVVQEVYEKVAEVGTDPPFHPDARLWWNPKKNELLSRSESTKFCGGWEITDYPTQSEKPVFPDFTFSDLQEFEQLSAESPEGTFVVLEDAAGLSWENKVAGILGTILSPARVLLLKAAPGQGWRALEFTYEDVVDFEVDSASLPTDCTVNITNSDGMSPTGLDFEVENLRTTISGYYKTSMVKDRREGPWRLIPPHPEKYIGNTRLFEGEVEGELFWDFSNPQVPERGAAVFNSGGWQNVEDGTSYTAPAGTVNYQGLIVQCDGRNLINGVPLETDHFILRFSVDDEGGKLVFEYSPKDYEGSVSFPQVTVSDSLTSSYTASINRLIFSGLSYYASPNVSDSDTLLRLWKSDPLYCADSLSDRFRNPLVADLNSGPPDLNWERFFIRLPPSYGRNGVEWQRVSLISKNFTYWGSPSTLEQMGPPAKDLEPIIYEEALSSPEKEESKYKHIYSEPFLFSSVTPGEYTGGSYNNSIIVHKAETTNSGYREGRVTSYDPLHNRRVEAESSSGRVAGEWKGNYYRKVDCEELSGFLYEDLSKGRLVALDPPIWDSSIYKIPEFRSLGDDSGEVDANHFIIGYAFFCSDLSAAGEAVFDFG